MCWRSACAVCGILEPDFPGSSPEGKIGMITLEINDSEIGAALNRLARAVTDMTPVMQDIGEELVVSTRKRSPPIRA